MQLRAARVALLLVLCPVFLLADDDEPVVPIERRGPVDVPSLVTPADLVPETPPAVRETDVSDVDPATFELLPAERREVCLDAYWSWRLPPGPTTEHVSTMQRCIDETRAAAENIDELLARIGGDRSRDVEHAQNGRVLVGTAQIPVRTLSRAITGDANRCGEGLVIDRECVEREILTPLRTHLALPEGAIDDLDAASARVKSSASLESVAGGGAGVAAFAASWEGIVINAIADQMVVQLQGAAATRLLNVFGNSICVRRVHGTDVRSFFPETCNLLLMGKIDTSSSNAIAQLPGEFQRTLRNDTLASLPGFLTAAGAKDPAVAALGPVLLQFAADPSQNLASAYCATAPGENACATFTLLRAANELLRTCTVDCAAQFAPALKQWQDVLGIDPEQRRVAADVYARLAALRAAAKDDRVARIALFFDSIDAFGPQPSSDAAGMLMLRKWDGGGYGWATVALKVYQLAEDFRRGYEPIDLANKIFEDTKLCVAPVASSYDTGCALKFTALAAKSMRDTLKQNTSSEVTLDQKVRMLTAGLQTAIDDITDPALHAWVTERKLAAKVSTLAVQTGPEFVQLASDIELAHVLAKKKPRTKEEDEQLSAKFDAIIDGVFTFAADVTGMSVPEADADRAKRLITNTGVCWRAMREKNYGTLANALYSVALDSGVGKPFPPQVERYRLLLTNLVAAQNPDAFKDAVNTYLSHTAAPDAKFESKTGVWLTGLPGLGVRGAANEDDAGIFAPVGVDLVVNPGWRDGRVRFALYGQLLDLGHLVQLKYDGNDDDTSDVKFRDVFAPGLYLRYPWRSGFSFGAGTAYVPTASSDGSGERDFKQRWNAFLSYDLSWFRLWGAGAPVTNDSVPRLLQK
jgi:hypothetical protein